MSEETGDWEDDDDSTEDADDSEAPPYPRSPESPSAVPTQRKSLTTPISNLPRVPQQALPAKSSTEPSSLGSPTRRPLSPARNQERIETVSFTPRSRLRRIQPPQSYTPNPSPTAPSHDSHASTAQKTGVYQRHPFPHSLSSPQILAVPAPASPQTGGPTAIDMTPPRPRDSRPGHHRRHSSRRVSANSTMQSPAEILLSAGRGLGIAAGLSEVDEDSTVTLRNAPHHADVRQQPEVQGRPGSSLHPYVTTFTSPIGEFCFLMVYHSSLTCECRSCGYTPKGRVPPDNVTVATGSLLFSHYSLRRPSRLLVAIWICLLDLYLHFLAKSSNGSV